MQSGKEEVLCPLCRGRGHEHKEVLVVRWRSQELEQTLQNIADEATFGSEGGMDNPFDMQVTAVGSESD